ncbi:MAG TPA: DUF3606 domain-containing protein [Burkholderiaceae bacterium]
MPDNKSLSGGQDRKRINVNEDHEVRDWAKKFSVSPEKLKAAVAAVGGWADRGGALPQAPLRPN